MDWFNFLSSSTFISSPFFHFSTSYCSCNLIIYGFAFKLFWMTFCAPFLIEVLHARNDGHWWNTYFNLFHLLTFLCKMNSVDSERTVFRWAAIGNTNFYFYVFVFMREAKLVACHLSKDVELILWSFLELLWNFFCSRNSSL